MSIVFLSILFSSIIFSYVDSTTVKVILLAGIFFYLHSWLVSNDASSIGLKKLNKQKCIFDKCASTKSVKCNNDGEYVYDRHGKKRYIIPNYSYVHKNCDNVCELQSINSPNTQIESSNDNIQPNTQQDISQNNNDNQNYNIQVVHSNTIRQNLLSNKTESSSDDESDADSCHTKRASNSSSNSTSNRTYSSSSCIESTDEDEQKDIAISSLFD